jgi:hypothetical protein
MMLMGDAPTPIDPAKAERQALMSLSTCVSSARPSLHRRRERATFRSPAPLKTNVDAPDRLLEVKEASQALASVRRAHLSDFGERSTYPGRHALCVRRQSLRINP